MRALRLGSGNDARPYLAMLVVLMGAISTLTISILTWSSRRFETLQRLDTEYHLGSINHLTAIVSVVDELLVHLQPTGLDLGGAADLQAATHLQDDLSSVATVIARELEVIQTLQNLFDNPEFNPTLERIHAGFTIVQKARTTVDATDHLDPQNTYEALAALRISAWQLSRLHQEAKLETEGDLAGSSRRQSQVVLLLVLALVLIGAPAIWYLYSAVQSSIGRQRLAETAATELARHETAISSLLRMALAGDGLPLLYQEALKTVRDVLRVDSAEILQLSTDGKTLVRTESIGNNATTPSSLPRTVDGATALGNVLVSDQTVFVEDSHGEGSPTTSGICVAINGVHGPYGLLGAHVDTPREFSDEEQRLLESVSLTLAQAIRRNHAEGSLKVQASIIDQTYDAVISTDTLGNITSWNKSAERMFGYSANEALGKHIVIIYPENATGDLNDEVMKQVELHGQCTLERVQRTRAGREIKTLTSFSVLRDAIGNPVGKMAYILDISDRRLAEEALQANEAALKNAHRIARIGTWVQDIKTGRLDGSDEFYQLIERTPEEMTQSDPGMSFVHPEDRDSLAKTFASALDEDKEIYAEFRAVMPNGSNRTFASRCEIVRDKDGAPQRLVGVTQDITDRVKAEEELRASEASLRIAQRIARAGSWSIDANTGQLHVSPELAQMTGRPLEAFQDLEHAMDFIHYDDREHVNSVLSKALKDHQDFDDEFRVVWPDGTNKIVTMRGTMLWDKDGAPTAITGISQDITEQKTADLALRKSENLLAKTQRLAAIGSWDMDYETSTVYWSEEVFQIFGVSSETFVPTIDNFLSAIHEEDRALVVSAMNRAVEHHERYHAEFRIVRPDGSLRHVTADGEIVDATDQGPRRVVGSVQDITERKHSQIALERSEALLVQAQQVAKIGAWEWNLETGSGQMSDEMYRILGISPQSANFAYEEFLEYVHPEDRQLVEDGIQQSLETGERYTIDHRIVQRNGNVIQGHAEGEVFHDDSGKPIRMAGSVQDITERYEAEQDLAHHATELARSNAELEQFAYVASHDLQEPLRMVSSFTQLLQQRYHEQLDDDANEFIGFATEGVQRMQRLISDLLTYSRVRRRPDRIQQVDCEALLNGITNDLRVALDESEAQVTHGPLPTVWGDPTQLQQLFQNLLSNAVKFRSDDNPEVHIAAREIGKEWIFSMRDNGIGIDPQFTDRIFAIFQRLHTREEYPGTGIGLALCKSIVETHNGRMWVESQLGEGCTFYFALPKNPQPTAPRTSSRLTASASLA